MKLFHDRFQIELQKSKNHKVIFKNVLNYILKKEWSIGFKDQGLGHGTYGVLIADTNDVVFEDLEKEIAEHLIEIHNKSLKVKN